MRHGERIVLEVVLAIVFLLVHREIGHPAEGKLIFRYEAKSISTCEADLTEDFAYYLVLTRSEEDHISHFWRELRFEGRKLISGEKFENRTFWTISFIDDVGESSGSMRLRNFGE